ncbi:TTK family protein kinase [Tieghemostelium lacteum]|uniref:TTK family protein kinase n=1 Tax=Tieghemostelium lacteum TaxID=361077 RepID=A0A152A3D8_TIELA|nr:TTK family protein kinase [Tieghemostelium lacteum]|eukprot:KYR00773.1 TTK family protein kinase [Tieghemostelium lacteum]
METLKENHHPNRLSVSRPPIKFSTNTVKQQLQLQQQQQQQQLNNNNNNQSIGISNNNENGSPKIQSPNNNNSPNQIVLTNIVLSPITQAIKGSQIEPKDTTHPAWWWKIISQEIEKFRNGEKLKSTDDVQYMLKLYQRAISIINNKEHMNTLELAQIFSSYSTFLIRIGEYEDAKQTLKFMKINKIGMNRSEVHVSFALLEINNNNFEKSRMIIQKAIDKGAEPLITLEECIRFINKKEEHYNHAISPQPLQPKQLTNIPTPPSNTQPLSVISPTFQQPIQRSTSLIQPPTTNSIGVSSTISNKYVPITSSTFSTPRTSIPQPQSIQKSLNSSTIRPIGLKSKAMRVEVDPNNSNETTDEEMLKSPERKDIDNLQNDSNESLISSSSSSSSLLSPLHNNQYQKVEQQEEEIEEQVVQDEEEFIEPIKEDIDKIHIDEIEIDENLNNHKQNIINRYNSKLTSPPPIQSISTIKPVQQSLQQPIQQQQQSIQQPQQKQIQNNNNIKNNNDEVNKIKSFELAKSWSEVAMVNNKPYLRIEFIGKGGSGKVYKVLSQDLKIYALKYVCLGTDQNEINCQLNEIEMLKRLCNQPFIIQLIDYEVNLQKGYILLVLEFGEIDLSKSLLRLSQDPLSTSTHHQGGINVNYIRVYWQQMLQAVHTIHEERIVHGDLKPANFVSVAGNLKLIDFGIAKAIQSDDTTNIIRDSQIGTMNYISPEALIDTSSSGPGGKQCMKLGRASDIWSLGCILYEMAFGYPPFKSYSNMFTKYHAIINPNHVIHFPDHKNQNLLDVLKRCLQRKPQDRPTIPELLIHNFLKN